MLKQTSAVLREGGCCGKGGLDLSSAGQMVPDPMRSRGKCLQTLVFLEPTRMLTTCCMVSQGSQGG